MTKHVWYFIAFAFIAGFTVTSVHGESYSLQSPDESIKFSIQFNSQDSKIQGPAYSVKYKNDIILANATLGVEFEDGRLWPDRLSVKTTNRSTRDDKLELINGQQKTVPDCYNELAIVLKDNSAIQIRAYNEGIAFRYCFTESKTINIVRELTQFHFSKDYLAWEEHGTEGEYKKTAISTIQPKCETPLTVELKEGGPYACVMEACVIDYPRMWLTVDEDKPSALNTHLGGKAVHDKPFETPWRVIAFADRAGELLERNYFLQLLNPPSIFKDTSWIKPGTVMRCVVLNTEGCKKYIDFAAEHHIDYVHLDAGWYGPERDEASDPREPKDDLDMPFLLEYAKEKGIGITVYVNRIALDKYYQELFPLYEQWGIAGVKFGFVAVGPQEKMKWLYDAVSLAGEHHLLVDIHDSYRPSGMSRTLPNLLTQEGIRGNEHMPTSEHNVTLPFTRFPCGAGDYTICYYSNRIKTTHAHQLAASVVMYSPLQFIFWYDRPDSYQGEPEIELFESLPTVWDETRVLEGVIGDTITIARQIGEEWYVASLIDGNPRTVKITFDFLEPGKTYKASIYRDDESDTKNRTGVKIERSSIDSSTVLNVNIPAHGGYTVRCVPN